MPNFTEKKNQAFVLGTKKTMPFYFASNDIVYLGEALSASLAKVIMQPVHYCLHHEPLHNPGFGSAFSSASWV